MKRLVCAIGVVAVLGLGGCTAAPEPKSNLSSASSTSSPSDPTDTGSRADDLAARIERLARNHARDEDFHGALLVSSGDNVIFSGGYGMADSEKGIPITPATRFRIGSITKQFTATAILMEQALGTLSVDGLICEHVAHCPPAWAAVTIRHLLTHTSGIPELTELPEFDGTENVPTTPARTMALFADEPLEFAPGDQFSYTNSGYVLLGIILEHTSGITYEEYVESRILVPLGMADSGYEHDGDGVAVGYAKDDGPAQDIDMSVPYAFGALYSTVEDLHRWERAAAGGRLVPATALTDGAIGAPPADWEKAMTYGFGVIITESRDHRLVGHSGEINGFAAYYATYPDDDFSVVILSNREDWGILGLADAIEGMLFSG